MKPIFSMYMYFKLTVWSIAILSTIFIFATFFPNDAIDIAVKPVINSRYYDSTIAKFDNNNITVTGNLIINNPTLYQRIVLPQSFIEFSFLRNLFVLICCIILLTILPYTQKQNLLKKNISKQIVLIGSLCIVYGFAESYQTFLASKIIKQLTNQQFMAASHQLQNMLFVLGVIVCWFGNLYKQSFYLKQEQNLTI